MKNKFKPRKWQSKAFKIVDKCNVSTKTEVIPVNACVGSGKTIVGSYALGSFIKINKDKKTIQAFVTPRIKLCAQQTNEIINVLKNEFDLNNEDDYELIRKDCTQNKINLRNSTFSANHAIFVICDESLWGTDNNTTDPEGRWHSWIKFFNERKNEGYIFGNMIFDEAHNFENKCHKII